MNNVLHSVRKVRRGFTLIELIVVIAIIAILTAILFPVFAQAREKARAISCLSNMKQLGLDMRMYSQDYDERAGSVSTWFCPSQAPEVPPQQGEGSWQALSLYYPYIKNSQIYRCPDQPSLVDYGQLVWNPMNGNLYNYFCTNTSPIPLLDMVGENSKGPAGTIIIAEASNVWLWDWGDQNGAQSLWPRLCAPHNGGLNCAFVDGHAKWMNYNSLTTADFGAPQPGIPAPKVDAWGNPMPNTCE